MVRHSSRVAGHRSILLGDQCLAVVGAKDWKGRITPRGLPIGAPFDLDGAAVPKDMYKPVGGVACVFDNTRMTAPRDRKVMRATNGNRGWTALAAIARFLSEHDTEMEDCEPDTPQ